MVIIGIMSKSGCGKSTVINKLCENKIYHNIKSYTTRGVRQNDPNDINTHVFVDKEFWEENKLKSWATYFDKVNDYVNWTDEVSFNKYKINLYAIDPKAFWGVSRKNKDTFGIYLELDEEERKERLTKRGSKYQEEHHLSSEHLTGCQNKVIININNKTVDQVAELIENAVDVFLASRNYTKINAILCKKCNRILFSRNRHDFNVCDKCKETFIDGGFDYVRVGAKNIETDVENYPIILNENIFDIMFGKIENQIQLE